MGKKMKKIDVKGMDATMVAFDVSLWVRGWLKAVEKNAKLPMDETMMTKWFEGALTTGYKYAWREIKGELLERLIPLTEGKSLEIPKRTIRVVLNDLMREQK